MPTETGVHLGVSDDFLEIVSAIYASASHPETLTVALRGFNDFVGGACAHAFTFSRSAGAILRSQISEVSPAFEEANRQYVTHWGARDPRTQLLARLAPGEVLRCHEHFDAAYVSASSFYQEFLIPSGFRWAMGGLFNTDGNTATVVADVRAPDAPPFEDWAARALRQLLPHFGKAALLRSQLNRQQPSHAGLIGILKALPMPALFTDSAGRCIERNDAFGDALEALSLYLHLGRLRFANPDQQRGWNAALRETDATAVGQSVYLTGRNAEPWRAHLVPMRFVVQEGDAFDKRMLLAIFEQKAATDPHPTVLSLASGSHLTAAEMGVLDSLLDGLPAKAIASRRGASVNTVRNQIMAILRKTGHRSQKALIAASQNSAFPPGS